MNLEALKELLKLARSQHRNHLVDPFRGEAEYLKGHSAFDVGGKDLQCGACGTINAAEYELAKATTNTDPLHLSDTHA
jgi:hypothetical protein